MELLSPLLQYPYKYLVLMNIYPIIPLLITEYNLIHFVALIQNTVEYFLGKILTRYIIALLYSQSSSF